jgi:hypothetical protein
MAPFLAGYLLPPSHGQFKWFGGKIKAQDGSLRELREYSKEYTLPLHL